MPHLAKHSIILKGDMFLFNAWFIPSPTLDVYSNVTLSTKPSLMTFFKIIILFPVPTAYPPSLVYSNP